MKRLPTLSFYHLFQSGRILVTQVNRCHNCVPRVVTKCIPAGEPNKQEEREIDKMAEYYAMTIEAHSTPGELEASKKAFAAQ